MSATPSGVAALLAATPPTGTDTPPPSTPPAGTPPAAAPTPWFSDAHKGLVEAKGWKTSDDALQSYAGLEKLLGTDKAQLLAVPKGDTDADGWSKVYEKLGRPATPGDYKIPVPDGQSDELVKAFTPKFHALGLSQKQAAGVAEAWNEHASKLIETQATAKKAQFDADYATLQTEWGGAFQQNIEMGKRAAKAFGFSEGDITALEESLGSAAVLRRFADMGKRVGEDKIPSGGGTSQFGISPEAAKQRIAEIKADPAKVKALTDKHDPGHAAILEQWTSLHKAMLPAG